MARITMIIDVEDNIDPTLNDPMEIADAVLVAYEDYRALSPQYPPVELVTAEWQ